MIDEMYWEWFCSLFPKYTAPVIDAELQKCECGASKDDGATLHVDHKIPVSKGCTDELSNLQTLCSDCNLNKSDVIQ